ncbi:penicillin-binding transpeptidase domain-containing protein [Gammaproteobacteria bacterium]|nr:penicillin-binding transpeptidase domain-containing protein [Gammaproteobacteria bacterium]
MKHLLFVASLLVLQACSSINDSLCRETDDNCTFVLFSESDDDYEIINQTRASKRFTPASTFKIANTIIALELGVVSNEEQELVIDYEKYPRQAWWQQSWGTQEYDLRIAFQNSVVPIYQEIASTIGNERMSKYLERFNYGNMNVSSGIDSFWLNGSLQISAFEQIEFLRGIYHNDFEVSKETVDSFLKVMLVEETERYKLYAKTGASLIDDGSLLAWYVGFVENDSGVHYFALNLQGVPSPETNQARINLTLNHLRQAGVI